MYQFLSIYLSIYLSVYLYLYLDLDLDLDLDLPKCLFLLDLSIAHCILSPTPSSGRAGSTVKRQSILWKSQLNDWDLPSGKP